MSFGKHTIKFVNKVQDWREGRILLNEQSNKTWIIKSWDFRKCKSIRNKFAIEIHCIKDDFTEWSFQNTEFANELFYHATIEALKNDTLKE